MKPRTLLLGAFGFHALLLFLCIGSQAAEAAGDIAPDFTKPSDCFLDVGRQHSTP